MGTHPIFESDFDCLTDCIMVRILGSEQELDKAKNEQKLVIIDFYADWCPPCRMIAPHLDQLVEENGGALAIYKVNVDHDHSEAIQTKNNIRVQSIPLFVGY